MPASRRFAVSPARSCRRRLTNRWIIASLASLAIVAATRSSVLAANGTWSASATTSAWQTAANWTSSIIPGATTGTTNTDTATFNNAGNGHTTITPDAGRNLENITFDTAAAAYTIGTTGGSALLLTSGGEVQIASTLTGSFITETVNAPITLEGSYTFADNSSNTANLLSFGGAITSGQSGTQTLTVTTSDNVTIGGAIGGGLGTIGLLKTGAGILALGGNDTFTGGVQINNGTLVLQNAGALNSTTPNSVVLNGSTASLELANNSVTVSGLTGNGIVQNESSSGSPTLTVNNSSSDLFSGVLQDGAGGGSLFLTKTGAGTLTLGGSNTFTGSITIDAGTLQVGSTGALGTGQNVVAFGASSTGTLSLNGNSVTIGSLQTNSSVGTPVVQNASATPATLTIAGGGGYAGVLQDGTGGGPLALVLSSGETSLSGNNTFTGGVTINGAAVLQLGSAGALNSTTPNAVALDSGTATLTLNGLNLTVSSLTGNGIVQDESSSGSPTLTVNNSSSDLFSGVLRDGAGGGSLFLTKEGAGTLTLGGNNTFTGSITIDAGTLQVGSTGALGTGQNVVAFAPNSFGILSLNGNSVTIGSLQANSFIRPVVQNASATPATLTIAGGGGYAGVLQDGAGGGPLAIVLSSDGEAFWSGNNTFTGGVTIDSIAVLEFGSAGALNLTTPNAVTFGSGSTGGLRLNGNSITISGLNTNATVGAPDVVNDNTTAATLTVNNANQNTYNGTLSDSDGGSSASLALVKSGAGTLTLGGNNTFTGGVTINAGAITIGNNSALGGGFVAVSGGTLQTDSNGPYTVANPILLNNSLTVSGSSNLTLSGPITGNDGLNKTGSNTLTLSGSPDSFSGTLTITGGTVNMNSSLACNVTNDAIFVYNSGTFSGRLTNLGTATFNAPFTAGNGLENDSILTIANGQSITLNGNGLNNTGTMTLAGGSLILGGINNFNSGTFNLSSTLPLNLGSASFTNSGTFNLNGGFLVGTTPAELVNEAGGVIVGSGTIQTPFSNSGGTLLVSGGTTNVTSSFTNSGLVQLTAANADLVGGTITNSGTIQGFGNLGNAVTNTGSIEPIGGTLAIGGTLLNPAGGLIRVGTGNKMLVINGLLASAGIVNLTGGTFDNNGQPMNNLGQISGFGTFASGGTGLTNNGSITFSGGLTTVNGPVTNESGETITIAQNPAIFTGLVTNNSGGTIDTTNTTATFAGGFTNNGSTNFAQVANGLLQIDSAPTLNASSSLQISGPGTLSFKAVSGAAVIGANVTATVASGATLELAGTVSALSDPISGNSVNIVNNATTASGGGLVVLGANQQVGVVSGSGDTMVGNGTSAASLTATQILQNTLTINANSTVTIAPSAGAGGGVIVAASTAAASNATATNETAAAATSSEAPDGASDPFTAIQAAILSGSISSTTGQRLENRIAAIEQLAAIDPGLDVSLLESRVLAALSPPPTSVLPSIGSAQLGDTGSGLLSVESSEFSSASGPIGATAAFASSASPTAVPEPSTLLLAAVAGIGLALAARRRRIGR